jgi:hypothetical protein
MNTYSYLSLDSGENENNSFKVLSQCWLGETEGNHRTVEAVQRVYGLKFERGT